MFIPRTTTARVSLTALALSLAPLLAATPAQAEVTLAQAVASAYERHPERNLAAGERDLAAALQDRADTLFAADPAFNLKYQTDAVGSDNGYREWEGGVEMPLWLPGQKGSRSLEAERTRQSAGAMTTAQRLTMAKEVRERLWGVALARNAEEDARLAYESAKELEQDIAHRVAAGELPRSDLLLAQKETVGREDEVQQAENLAQQAERLFARYTGLDAVPPATAEPLPAARELPPSHPRLVLAAASVDRARAHRDRVAGERRAAPSLWLGGKNTRAISGTDFDSSIGVEVTLPFGAKAYTAPALAEAELALTQALAEQDRERYELEDALERARLELQRTEQALEQARQREALADESLRLSRRAFELGETDLVRLLQVRSEAVAAHHDLEARGLELGQAAARLNQALGVIPQ